jgi:hypothetical protein
MQVDRFKEKLTFNQVVVGSNPTGPTNISAGFKTFGKI